ncbi:MAG TPA: formate dehydrogenase accessory protein FdhE [Pyrinomonadaceae bacterium]|nr:formate dehydrogenase accessory protein FdhE [Pyrinomonadaceae bacterium]
MADFWEQQIARADYLAAEPGGATELLGFYGKLLRAQQQIYQQIRGNVDWLPAGDLQSDLPKIRSVLPVLLKMVALHGPTELAAEAEGLLNAESRVIDQTLIDYWRSPSDIQFFAKAILQPYAYWLVENGTALTGRELAGGERSCPRCGGNPQTSVLQNKDSTAESGNRDLICATCLHSWEFRRVVCAHCGEEHPTKLGYFHSPEFEHIRIEACDSCRRYIKGIDLTRNGFATALVDEIYAAPLDLWAREHGYSKIELNLVGV